MLVVLFYKPSVHAVPSYSRQTGMPCATCHYAPPELTPFGRKFKLEGYTLVTIPTVSDDQKDHNAALQLLEAFPISVVFDTSFTSTKAPQPGTQNGNFQFPQDASLFLDGAWGSHVGSFVQVTYDGQSDHFSWDNIDIRFANNNGKLFGKNLTYGANFNNNPTAEDLWNSTPAWGFPYVSSSAAPTPSAGALVNGGLAQDVAVGLGLRSQYLDKHDAGVSQQLAKQKTEEEEYMRKPFEPELSTASLAAANAALADPLAAKGKIIFEGNSCNACHGDGGVGTAAAPALVGLSSKLSPEQVAELFKHPTPKMTAGGMPPVDLPPDDLKALIAYLESLK